MRDVILECLDDHGENTCRGVVAYRTIGRNPRAWPRCDFHYNQRYDRYENSIEKYADSDVPPAWFDPTLAGERWDDEY